MRTPTLTDRLAQTVMQFYGTDHDQIVAAVQEANDLLADHGLTWEQAITEKLPHCIDPPWDGPSIKIGQHSKTTTRTETIQSANWQRDNAAELLPGIKKAVANLHLLDMKERKFLLAMSEGTGHMSVKQRSWLEAIVTKVGRKLKRAA